MTTRILRRELMFGAAASAVAFGVSGCKKTTPPLVVGGLPVTCNLTLPVACAARAADLKAGRATGRPFEYAKYSGWPEIKEALAAGRVQAAYMLAPLIMDLKLNKVPVKIVSLGHRSGAVIMVHKESPYRKFKDLAGKQIAIPSRYAVDFLFLRKMLAQEGMTTADVKVVEMAPPDMPAALYARAVDAYCTGEPFGAAAERAGFAIPLRLTRNEWPNYICCVLTVREELLAENRPLVQDLVNYIQGAGDWLDASPENRDEAAELAAQRRFFNQDPEVIKFVMENPFDRVTYADLRMIPEEFDDLMRLSIEAKTLPREIPFDAYADASLVRVATAHPITL